MTAVLLVKLLLAPALVIASTLAGRHWGPRLAGILIVLPVVAGPILVIIYLEQGPAYLTGAASAATLGVVPLALYAVVFASVARRRNWLVSLLASCGTVLAVDVLLTTVRVPPVAALGLAVLALAGAGLLLRRRPITTNEPPPPSPPAWDLPARAVATALLVLLLTGLAERLGPVWTGVLTPFPIALSVVCAFTAAQSGVEGLTALLRGVVPGLNGFALFCCTVAVATPVLGGPVALISATAVAVVFAVGLQAVGARR